ADRLSTARSGSTGRRLDRGANPLLMSNGKVGQAGVSSRDLRLLGDSCGHPELSRRDADEALEVMTEPALARETRVRGDLRQGEVAALQKHLGSLDAAHDDELVRRQSGGSLELAREVVDAEAGDRGHLLQGQAGVETFLDVCDD